MDPECVKRLSTQVSRFLKLKHELKTYQEESKRLRAAMKMEEQNIRTSMDQLDITECMGNDVLIKVTPFRRQPVASLKNILPLIQRVFDASPERMQVFEEEVKEFRANNASTGTRVQCREKRAKVTRAPTPAKAAAQVAAAASLSSALMSY
jgi:hypothetical protein